MAEWVLGVSQLNEYVRRQLAADPMLKKVRVRGEISGFKRHYSGHLYFALKDEQARVQCVMFRQSAMSLGFEPKDGMQVVVVASASLYVQGGSFQLYCEAMQDEGHGELFVRFERLKASLESEGLFDASLKKPLPLLPRRIGVVTSKAGAALQDIIRVAQRRFPGLPILLASAAVQGDDAAQEIADALDALNRIPDVDVILCGRGGGSIEELWAFNEEVVARAIYRSNIPVVSCVGHETDFTIADFVADVRAATPSMAAELAVPERDDLLYTLQKIEVDMTRAQTQRIEWLRARIQQLKASPVLKFPGQMLLSAHKENLRALKQRLTDVQSQRLAAAQTCIAALSGKLAALDPASVLQRGYAVVEGDAGILTSAKSLKEGERVRIVMQGGRAGARIEQIELEGKAHGKA